ncbi:MAG: efflux RND transporter periplasmic adaptor subunit, partial [Armatimonadota bacterium]|nr:efflux RND transporter periplasmic adaptor subunit [Armatimonadota bacterium]
AIPVEVASVQRGTIASTVQVTGSIQALQDVQLSARAAGRVIAVNFREGQVVRAGQVVVQQDTTDLQANVRQAQANVAQAEQNVSSNTTKVSQARINYTLQVQTAKQAVAQARAQVANANQNYLKIKGGSRPQQVLQGQSQVLLAKANLDNAQTILTRNKSLFAQGAIAKSDLDTAQTNYEVEVQTYKNAQQALSLTQAGAQTEDIAAARALLQQQQANLSTAIANQQQVQVRQQDILAAQDAVRQAKAAVQQQEATLAFNEQQVANAFIRAPFDGIVAAREVEPGQIASPGTNLMRVVNVKTVYYEPTVSETDFAQTTVGDSVQVQVDALPGRTFSGLVKAVYPAASSGSRQFTLRVAVPNPTNELRPGMFARGTLMAEVHRNAVVIPVSALVPILNSGADVATSEGTATGGTTLPPQQVFLVGAGNKAMARKIKTGIVTQSQVEVTSGLQPGDSLITVGQGQLVPGQPIKIESTANGVGAGLATL